MKNKFSAIFNCCNSLIDLFKWFVALDLIIYFIGVVQRIATANTDLYFDVMRDPVFITMLAAIAVHGSINAAVVQNEITN